MSNFDVPEINNLLIIGISDTAMEFSINIQGIAKFNRIHHVQGIEQATLMMERIKFSVVVIDNDATFNSISCSRIVRINNSQVRIVFIGSTDSHNPLEIINLKNKGIIHAYIPIPIDDIVAHTIIVKEQAKFEINKSLDSVIENPPAESHASRSFADAKPVKRYKSRFYIVGVAIVESTVMVHSFFLEDDLEVDTSLLSSYMSAISIFGNTIFDTKTDFEGFYFGDISIFICTIDTAQYVFFVRNVNDDNHDSVEQLSREIARKLYVKYSQVFSNPMNLDNNLEEEINETIKLSLPRSHRQDSIIEIDDKPIIVNLSEPPDNLIQLYDETTRAYEVVYTGVEDQLIDMIKSDDIDTVIVNTMTNQYKIQQLTSLIKDLSPYTQIIVVIDEIAFDLIFHLLNTNTVDYLLTPTMAMEDVFNTIKEAIDTARRIKNGVYQDNPYQILVSSNKASIIKTLLRENDTKFVKSTSPKLVGLFIMTEGRKFYADNYSKDYGFVEHENLFTGFIEALTTFTGHVSKSPVSLYSIEYGDSKMMLEQEGKYIFVYFIRKLDSSNYDLVEQEIRDTTSEMYQFIQHQTRDKADQQSSNNGTPEIKKGIESIVEKLISRFGSV